MEESKQSGGFGRYVYWAGVILVLYVLSWGPLVWIDIPLLPGQPLSLVNRFFLGFTYPGGWAYSHTPFHKPLGMYFHLWRPQMFDKNGEVRLGGSTTD